MLALCGTSLDAIAASDPPAAVSQPIQPSLYFSNTSHLDARCYNKLASPAVHMCCTEEQRLRYCLRYTQYPSETLQPKDSIGELAQGWDMVEGERTEAGE